MSGYGSTNRACNVMCVIHNQVFNSGRLLCAFSRSIKATMAKWKYGIVLAEYRTSCYLHSIENILLW